jgi:hypothetical protein
MNRELCFQRRRWQCGAIISRVEQSHRVEVTKDNIQGGLTPS